MWSRLKALLKAAGARQAWIVTAAPHIDVCCVNSADIVLLRKALPSLQARHHVIPLYTVEDSFEPGGTDMAGPDILLGNSARATNNHIEAFELLGARKADSGRVVVPLSYGDPGYARAVAAIGRQWLGERLDPVLEWMSISDYNRRVGGCGFVVMNHRRQQAVGNIGAALFWGATVYLRRENPLFSFYTDLGVHIRAVDELATGLDQPLQPLTRRAARTQRALRRQVLPARHGRRSSSRARVHSAELRGRRRQGLVQPADQHLVDALAVEVDDLEAPAAPTRPRRRSAAGGRAAA